MTDLPDPDDPDGIEAYASAFDGYGHTPDGQSLEVRARARRRETLADLRAELFLTSRAARFSIGPVEAGEIDPLTALYRELLPLLRDRLTHES